MSTVESSLPGTSRRKRFIVNVIWNWASVAVSLATGFFLSPYLIRKLGEDGYGVWALSFALVEYYWFFDLGFRSATLKYVAHYSACGDPGKTSEIINTSFFYGAVTASLILALVVSFSRSIVGFFQIPGTYHDSFVVLLRLITLSWCLGIVFNIFSVCMEAVQRFDITNRISIATNAVRSAGTFLLLFLGYGLIEVGMMVVISQFFGYCLNYYSFRRVFPFHRISPRSVKTSALRQMASFGIHSFLIGVSTQAQNQTPSLLIGHFLPAAFVGFYNVPARLIQYVVEFVGRIGVVTNTNVAEFAARNESGPISQLAIYTNRYCLTLFMPAGIFLYAFGGPFFARWVGPRVASHSAPLLPVLLIGYVLAIVGQSSSAMVLMGLGKHQRYARGLVAEAVLGFVSMLFVVPRYGILGAAFVISILMILNRGVYTSWLVSRVTKQPFLRYLHHVYTGPAAAAVPVAGLAFWLRSTMLSGQSWAQLLFLAGILGIAYYALALFLCIKREHRALLLTWIAAKCRIG